MEGQRVELGGGAGPGAGGFCVSASPQPRKSTLFPYTTLFRSAVVGIMGRNCGAEGDETAFLVGVGGNRAAEVRVLEVGRAACRVSVGRGARFRPAGGRGDGEVLGAVLAGMEGQRVELGGGAGPGAGGCGVSAGADSIVMFLKVSGVVAGRAVVGIMGRNCGAEGDETAFLVGVGGNRAAEVRVL